MVNGRLGTFVGNGLTHGRYAPGLRYHAAGVADESAGPPVPAGFELASSPSPGGVPGIFKPLTEQAGLSWAVHPEAIGGAALPHHHAHALLVIEQSRRDQVVLQEQGTVWSRRRTATGASPGGLAKAEMP